MSAENDTAPSPVWLSPAAVAERLGVPERDVTRGRLGQRLNWVRVTRALMRIDERDLIAWQDAARRAASGLCKADDIAPPSAPPSAPPRDNAVLPDGRIWPYSGQPGPERSGGQPVPERNTRAKSPRVFGANLDIWRTGRRNGADDKE